MPRKAKVVWQVRFNLDQNNPAHQRLHDHLSKLAEDGEASAWMIEALVAALPAQSKVAVFAQPTLERPAQPKGIVPHSIPAKIGGRTDANGSHEPHYEEPKD